MPGPRLSTRIAHIASGAPAQRISQARTVALIAICIAICFAFAVGTVTRAREQQPDSSGQTAFEVASIRPHVSNPVADSSMNSGCGDDPGRCSPRNVTAKGLIATAFDRHWDEISGGPPWIDTEKFDIDATIPDSAAAQLRALRPRERRAQERRMLQSLLAARFKLAVSHSTKELPLYTLLVSKPNRNLQEVPPPDPAIDRAPSSAAGWPSDGLDPPTGELFWAIGTNGNATLVGKAANMSDLAEALSTRVGRRVVDRTGFSGAYDFKLNWTADVHWVGGHLSTGGDDSSPDISGISIFSALNDQLGLKLEASKGPVDTIVIDHIEEPSPN
jgi:uncharacterized protein (TIGR03435 family)